MLDQDLEDVHSVHSIGVVENPLYADQEDYEGPTYAGLAKKEKELEVSCNCASLNSSLAIFPSDHRDDLFSGFSCTMHRMLFAVNNTMLY